MESRTMFLDKKFNIMNMSILSKLIYKCNMILPPAKKMPKGFLLEIDNLILKNTLKNKQARIARKFQKRVTGGVFLIRR